MRVGYRTDVGRARPINEDALWADGRLLVLADGMGGHQAGEVASRMAVELVVARLNGSCGALDSEPDPEAAERVRASLCEANEAVYAKALQDPGLRGMGTTLTVALLAGGEAVIGHVGDSRAYLVRPEAIVQLTEDHSVVWELVKSGGLTRDQAQVHPYRNLLTRALGTSPEVEVDTLRLRLQPEDGLLLCSDGLTSVLADAEIHDIIKRSKDPQTAVDRLIDEANARGAPDNVSAILAMPEAADCA